MTKGDGYHIWEKIDQWLEVSRGFVISERSDMRLALKSFVFPTRSTQMV